MKKLLLGAALGLSLISSPYLASAVEFTAQGEWFFGFGGVESTLLKNNNFGADGESKDVFEAQQRLRLYFNATASESLSATIGFQIGDTIWGKNGGRSGGGALGTDGAIVGVRDAYLDWIVPNSKLMFRMGLQGIATPNAAGGSAIIDDQVAAIVASYQANDTFGLTAFWLRPFNDNFGGVTNPNTQVTHSANYLDNADFFGISAPIVTGTMEITPWAMVGFVGKNAVEDMGYGLVGSQWRDPTLPVAIRNEARKSYGIQYYVGLPIIISAFDPINIEIDLNYGHRESMGRYDNVSRPNNDALVTTRREDSKRQGWLIKSLFEYKLDWATPGILAWYASGDDGNVKNGSERLPTISPSSNFTSFMQDGAGYSIDGGYDLMLEYGGTWGLGLQLNDLSLMENVSHNLRAVYWGGTNSAAMIKTFQSATAWQQNGAIYLTTLDHLIEFNVDTSIKIYENLTAIVELGYIVNGVDGGAWRKNINGADRNGSQTKDAWKADLLMKYEF